MNGIIILYTLDTNIINSIYGNHSMYIPSLSLLLNENTLVMSELIDSGVEYSMDTDCNSAQMKFFRCHTIQCHYVQQKFLPDHSLPPLQISIMPIHLDNAHTCEI